MDAHRAHARISPHEPLPDQCLHPLPDLRIGEVPGTSLHPPLPVLRPSGFQYAHHSDRRFDSRPRGAKDPAKGLLALPGGFVDPGESLEEALLREINEEIGLSISNPRYLTSHPNPYTYAGLTRPVCDVFFLADTASFDVTLQQEEIAGWEFRRPEKINPAELAFDSMRHALAVFLKNS